MGRSIDEVIAELPSERQERIEAKYRELKLIVKLPDYPAVRLRGLGEVLWETSEAESG